MYLSDCLIIEYLYRIILMNEIQFNFFNFFIFVFFLFLFLKFNFKKKKNEENQFINPDRKERKKKKKNRVLYTRNGSFPGSSVGKESTFNAVNLSLIPGSGRSAGEGIGYPLQNSWTSLVAQLVKNLPAMRETWVQSLGWEDPLEKGKATYSSILAWRIPWAV